MHEHHVHLHSVGRLVLLAAYRPQNGQKINRLIEDITLGDPFSGIGKPEPLRYQLSGAWLRRSTEEHRLVYQVHDDTLTIVAARYHYGN